ncbi:MAG: helix-turn-helix domain-containing protein [Lachnospiraceae bacterium]|nr:helix-turn-helix domain-containing protein [Lachnospiraceae bacterium]
MINQILATLRKNAGFTQEQLAEKIGVSRQAVANWEKGENTPDISKCIALADLYGVSIDALVGHPNSAANTTPPKGKYFFGSFTVGARGQIVIPKKAREIFHIQEGDQLLLFGDEDRGLAILPANAMKELMQAINTNTFTKKEDW